MSDMTVNDVLSALESRLEALREKPLVKTLVDSETLIWDDENAGRLDELEVICRWLKSNI